MAELKCSDGTVIQISDETEKELRKTFSAKPSYKDSALRVCIDVNKAWPITISIVRDYTGGREYVSRNIQDTEAFIVALQKSVNYCEEYNLGT